VYVRLGRPAEAVQHHIRALQIARKTETLCADAELGALNGLARALSASGRDDEATHQYEAAVILARRLGDRIEHARALDGLGDLASVDGRSGEAISRWREAQQICLEIGIPLADDVQTKLAMHGEHPASSAAN